VGAPLIGLAFFRSPEFVSRPFFLSWSLLFNNFVTLYLSLSVG